MASRQLEKEARREARLEQEAAEQRTAARRRRLQLVFGGVLALGIVAAIAIAISAGGGGKDASGAPIAKIDTSAKLPPPQITEVKPAAAAAGCTLTNPPEESRGHDTKTFTAADYQTNPPTSGAHDPVAAQDGVYDPGNNPPLGQLVHTLEHGRIDVQYKPGTDPRLVAQLKTFVAENGPYHMVLFQNQTGMKPQVAVTAWDHALSCPKPGPKMWDALRTFRDTHLDQGPEKGL